MERISPDTSLGKLLGWCATQHASDIHAQATRRYAYRVDGKLLRIPPETFPAPGNDEMQRMLKEAFSGSISERIEKQHEVDFSFLWTNVRYRANFSKQQGMQSFSFRVVPRWELARRSSGLKFARRLRARMLNLSPIGIVAPATSPGSAGRFFRERARRAASCR